jgi:integrase
MIYFIQDDLTKHVKIGYTKKSVYSRFHNMQVSTPHKLSILLAMPGNIHEERRLHERFKQDKIRGEWYTLTPNLKKIIRYYSSINNSTGSPYLPSNPTIDRRDLIKMGVEDKTGIIIMFIIHTGCRISDLINITNKNIKYFKDDHEYGIDVFTNGEFLAHYRCPEIYMDQARKLYNHESEYLFHVTKAGYQKDTRGGRLNRGNLYKQIRTKFNKIGYTASPETIRRIRITDKTFNPFIGRV